MDIHKKIIKNLYQLEGVIQGIMPFHPLLARYIQARVDEIFRLVLGQGGIGKEEFEEEKEEDISWKDISGESKPGYIAIDKEISAEMNKENEEVKEEREKRKKLNEEFEKAHPNVRKAFNRQQLGEEIEDQLYDTGMDDFAPSNSDTQEKAKKAHSSKEYIKISDEKILYILALYAEKAISVDDIYHLTGDKKGTIKVIISSYNKVKRGEILSPNYERYEKLIRVYLAQKGGI